MDKKSEDQFIEAMVGIGAILLLIPFAYLSGFLKGKGNRSISKKEISIWGVALIVTLISHQITKHLGFEIPILEGKIKVFQLIGLLLLNVGLGFVLSLTKPLWLNFSVFKPDTETSSVF